MQLSFVIIAEQPSIVWCVRGHVGFSLVQYHILVAFFAVGLKPFFVMGFVGCLVHALTNWSNYKIINFVKYNIKISRVTFIFVVDMNFCICYTFQFNIVDLFCIVYYFMILTDLSILIPILVLKRSFGLLRIFDKKKVKLKS